MKREQKKRLNQEIIINAAYNQMTKNGIQKTSIKDISTASGISSVTLYKYFEDKNDLVELVALKFFKKIMEKTLVIASDSNLNFQQKFESFKFHVIKIRSSISDGVMNEFLKVVNNSEKVHLFFNQTEKQIAKLMIESGRQANVINTEVSNQSIEIFANILIDYLSNHENLCDKKILDELETLFFFGIHGKNDLPDNTTFKQK